MTTANVPYDKERFVAAVLQGMGWEPTAFRMNLMREWISGEGTGAGYNPLATTQEGGEDPSDPFWNDNGGNPVKNYRDFDTGVAQTIRTLSNQYYPALRATFETEQIQPGAAENAATWGTMHLANVLGGGGVSSNGKGYSGAPQSSYTPPDLPFPETEYLIKYTRFRMLQSQLFDPMSPNPDFPYRADADPALLQELFTLEAELNDYTEKKSQGAQDYQDYLDQLDWSNRNDPRIIDATNTANAWARQNSLNQAAMTDTNNDMLEQRQGQESAETSTANWKGSSAFGSPMGFRVPSTNLPTEDEVFAKNIDRISKNLPEVTPLPYAAPRSSIVPDAPSTGTGPSTQPTSVFSGLRPSSIKENAQSHIVRQTAGGVQDAVRSIGAGIDGWPAPAPMPTAPPLSSSPGQPLPVPSRAPTPTSSPVATGTPTPPGYRTQYQPSPLALTDLGQSVRRFMGSIFGGR